MTDLFYAVVKASLHASDASVFGLKNEEIQALISRYPGSAKNVVNGVLINANPLQVINSLGELGYRVVCSSGDSDIVWTLKREGLVDPDYYPGKETQIAKQILEQAGQVDNEPEQSHQPNRQFSTLTSLTPTPNDMSSVQKKIKRDSEPGSSTSQEQQMAFSDTDQEFMTSSKDLSEDESKKKQYKMGASPEDFKEYLPDPDRIMLRNPQSFDHSATEGVRVILKTNECSPENPLIRSGGGTGPSFCTCFSPSSQQMFCMMHPNMQTLPNMQSMSQMQSMPHMQNLPASGSKGLKPIWHNAMLGEASAVNDQISKGVNVNQTDPSGYTALHYAAKNGNVAICQSLINSGAQINIQTQAGNATALHRAAGAGKTEVVKLLLNNGAHTLLRDVDGRTALHRAVEGGHEAATTLLIEHCMEAMNVRDNRGCRPIDLAKDESLKALIKRITASNIQAAPSPSKKNKNK